MLNAAVMCAMLLPPDMYRGKCVLQEFYIEEKSGSQFD